MKTVEEIFKTIDSMIPHPYRISRGNRETIKNLIRNIQIDAYNQALEDACNHDKVNVYYDENVGYCTLQQSILKLKK